MIGENAQLLGLVVLCGVLLLIAGFFCILVTSNLIRILIGVELLAKGLTVLLLAGGYFTGQVGLAQALIVVFIVVEVVAIAVAAGVVIGAHKHTRSLNRDWIQNLKG